MLLRRYVSEVVEDIVLIYACSIDHTATGLHPLDSESRLLNSSIRAALNESDSSGIQTKRGRFQVSSAMTALASFSAQKCHFVTSSLKRLGPPNNDESGPSLNCSPLKVEPGYLESYAPVSEL